MKCVTFLFLCSIFSVHVQAQKIEAQSDQPGERVIKGYSSGAQAWSIYGQAEGFNGHGVVGIASGPEGRGVYGVGDIAIHGSASGAEGIAGQFDGDLKITGLFSSLEFPDQSQQTTAFRGKELFYQRSYLSGLVGDHASITVSCFCDEGDVVLGGGWDAYRNEGSLHDYVSNTYFNKPTAKTVNGKYTGGWQIGFRNNSNEFYRVKVFAICADVN